MGYQLECMHCGGHGVRMHKTGLCGAWQARCCICKWKGEATRDLGYAIDDYRQAYAWKHDRWPKDDRPTLRSRIKSMFRSKT